MPLILAALSHGQPLTSPFPMHLTLRRDFTDSTAFQPHLTTPALIASPQRPDCQAHDQQHSTSTPMTAPTTSMPSNQDKSIHTSLKQPARQPRCIAVLPSSCPLFKFALTGPPCRLPPIARPAALPHPVALLPCPAAHPAVLLPCPALAPAISPYWPTPLLASPCCPAQLLPPAALLSCSATTGLSRS